MAATSNAASRSASTMAATASALYSSTTHIDWGSKGQNVLFSVHKYYWELFPLCFIFLVQIVLIVCYAGIILALLSSGMLAILLGFELGSLLGFTIIYVQIFTWGSGKPLYFHSILGLMESAKSFLIHNIEISVRSVWWWFGDVSSALRRPYC